MMASLTNTRHYRLSIAGFEIPVVGKVETTNGRLCGDAFATLIAAHGAGEIVMVLDPEDPGKPTQEPVLFAPETDEAEVKAPAKKAKAVATEVEPA